MNEVNFEIMDNVVLGRECPSTIALKNTRIALCAAKDSVKAIAGYEERIYLITKSLELQRSHVRSEEQYIDTLRDMAKLCTNRKNRNIHSNHFKSCMRRFHQQRKLLLRNEKQLIEIESLAAMEKEELERIITNCQCPNRDEEIVIDSID